MCGGDLCEVAVRAAVDVGDGDDVRALGEGLKDCGSCCGSGGEGKSEAGVFKGGDGAFEIVSGVVKIEVA